MNIILHKLIEGKDLTKIEAEETFQRIIEGKVGSIPLTALLLALRLKGETPDEIAGAALSLRKNAMAFERPNYLFADSCGTGGDGSGTFNISTAAAFVSASCGLPIVKHGNRSLTSKCGSADVLQELGANIDLSPQMARKCLDETSVCFLFAPLYHQGVSHAMNVRKQIGTRTIFNILGPLINPASPSVQIIGVYKPELTRPIAETLKLLGTKSALVVHGSGLDEIATHGPTKANILRNGVIKDIVITPKSLGLKLTNLSAQDGGDHETNAKILLSILKGKGRPEHIDIVSANVGALLYLAGKVETMASGVSVAKKQIKSGLPYKTLKAFIDFTLCEITA